MSNQREDQNVLAVLIDADNAQASIIEGLLTEVTKFGVASVRRIYGDWTTPQLGKWKEVLLQHSIQPIQQFRYTVGKNATDNAMIIDAMDLLHSGRFDGFCLVSSDSDFTRLASRIREQGLKVYGFGERKTPQSFVSACEKFVYTEVLRAGDEAAHPVRRKSVNELKCDTRLAGLLRGAIEAASDDAGWAHLAAVGSNIAKQAPDFDPRNYGYKRLRELLAATQLFDLDERRLSDGVSRAIYLRDKRKKGG
ncbi:MAG: NYN domain-containing protein [Candidatus Aureabacteria bacterium]|nr:NYN domain-containing protein [Candidatus Auribacterota bacterium]